MAAVFVLADLLTVTEKLYEEVTLRLEASEKLLVWAADLKALVKQVKDTVSTLPETSSVGAGIEATNKLLGEILDWIKADQDYVEHASCCSLFIHAKDYSGQVVAFEDRLRKQVTLLSQLVTIKSMDNNVAQIIKNPAARQYWMSNFGDRDRCISWQLLLDSFTNNFGALNEEHLIGLKNALLFNSEDSVVSSAGATKADLVANDQVTVFRYSSVFAEDTVENIVKTFQADLSDRKRVWHIISRDPTTKDELDVDAGFVLVPEGGTLSAIRSAIVAELEDDEDLSEEFSFLTTAPGKFHFYLDNGKGSHTRVKKNQEGILKGNSLIDSASLVPDKDGITIIEKYLRQGRKIPGYTPAAGDEVTVTNRSGEVSAFKIMPIEVAEASPLVSPSVSGAPNGSKVAPAPAVDEDADDVATLDKGMLAMSQAKKTADLVMASVLTVQDILEDASLLHQFRKTLVDMQIAENNLFFLQRMSEGSFSMDSLAQYQADMQGKNGLLLSESTKKRLAAHDPASASDSPQSRALLNNMQMDVVSRLSQEPLEKFKKALQKKPRTKGIGKGKRVCILGGGVGGVFAACMLIERCPELSIIMIDMKEYYEDTTMIIRGMLRTDWWSKNGWCPHSAYLRLADKKDQLIIGRVMELHHQHVVINANKQIVPFDYCINFTGSSYTSDIKTDNITSSHRELRMSKERENIERSKRVVVIGGGLVGTEMASGVKAEFPGKDVTLIHRSNDLLNRIPGAGDISLSYLRNMGVKVYTNRQVGAFAMDEDNRGFFPVTIMGSDRGAEIRPVEDTLQDISSVDAGDGLGSKIYIEGTKVMWCTGYVPNTAHFRAGDSELAAGLDSRGFVQVNDHMQVIGSADGNIFAGGDCVHDKRFPNGERTAHYAGLHAVAIARNIIRIMQKDSMNANGTVTLQSAVADEGKNDEGDYDLLDFSPTPEQKASLALIDLGWVDALMVVPQNYDHIMMYFGEHADAANAALQPSPKGPKHQESDIPTRIGVINGAAAFKEGFIGSIIGMIKAGGTGLFAMENQDTATLGILK